MLITCDGCASKIRVPDRLAGKRGKCPKCAAPLEIPKLEPPEDFATPEPEEVAVAPPPPKKADAKVPAVQSKHGDTNDEDDDDNYETAPEPRRKRRRPDDDDDDEDGEVRRRRRPKAKRKSISGAAIASMILGIASICLVIFGSCCFGPFTYGVSFLVAPPIAAVIAIVSLVMGSHGKKPGSEGFAWTGIICSYVTLFLVLILVLVIAIAVIMPGPGGRRRF